MVKKRKNSSSPDFLLLAVICVLGIWGLFTLATVSFPFSLQKFGHSWYYFFHQLFFGLLPGTLVIFILYRIDLKTLKKLSPYFLGLNLFLLLLLFLPKIGLEIKGGRRWLNLGAFLIQPSEFLKITFLVYLSAWLSSRLNIVKKTKRKLTGSEKWKINWQAPFVFLAILFVLGTILILQPDLSSLAIIFLASLSIFFVSSTPWWQSVLIALGGGGLAAFLIKITPYRLSRVLVMFNSQIDPLGTSYQLKQSLVTVGSGKIAGIESGFALGLSRQKFGFLPEPMTDSIFAIIGEEFGFLGAMALILLFLFFVWRGLRIAFASPEEFTPLESKHLTGFTRLLAVGISTWLGLQAFFNIAGIFGILPIAGIPLPFFSYGSSHLITEMAGVGILLNISRKI